MTTIAISAPPIVTALALGYLSGLLRIERIHRVHKTVQLLFAIEAFRHLFKIDLPGAHGPARSYQYPCLGNHLAASIGGPRIRPFGGKVGEGGKRRIEIDPSSRQGVGLRRGDWSSAPAPSVTCCLGDTKRIDSPMKMASAGLTWPLPNRADLLPWHDMIADAQPAHNVPEDVLGAMHVPDQNIGLIDSDRRGVVEYHVSLFRRHDDCPHWGRKVDSEVLAML